jgi:hypothetical protein
MHMQNPWPKDFFYKRAAQSAAHLQKGALKAIRMHRKFKSCSKGSPPAKRCFESDSHESKIEELLKAQPTSKKVF